MTSAAGRVGAGLAPARDARPIRPGERIHVVGAAGAGASGAALLAVRSGAAVTGCDAGGPSPYTAALEAAGVTVATGHAAEHVTTPPAPERLAVTKALTAIDPDHPELAAARDRGIPVEPWQQAVADAAVGRRLVGVAGTHGKSTTAGWLVHALTAAGQDPSAFVVETDEYAGNFDPYRPEVAILTSAEWDHPDVFQDRDAVTDAFAAWLSRLPIGATVIANVGDPGVEAVLDRLLDQPIHLVAYA